MDDNEKEKLRKENPAMRHLLDRGFRPSQIQSSVLNASSALTWSFSGGSESTSLWEMKRQQSQCMRTLGYANTHLTKSLQLWVLTFDNFGNSLRFLVDQIGVSVEGGDLGEIWAWTLKTKQLFPKRRQCFTHSCGVTLKSTISSLPPWSSLQIIQHNLMNRIMSGIYEINLFGIKRSCKDTLPEMIWGSITMVFLPPPSHGQREKDVESHLTT